MDIEVTVRHGQVSDQIQNKIRQKLEKLSRYFDRISKTQLIADLKHTESPRVENHRVR